MSTITIHTDVGSHSHAHSHSHSSTIPLTTDSAGDTYFCCEKVTRIDAALDSTDPTLTVTVTPSSGASVRVHRVTGTSSGTYDASAGLTWSYSGADLVLVFTRPSSGHEYTWEFDDGTRPPVKLTVKISRP